MNICKSPGKTAFLSASAPESGKKARNADIPPRRGRYGMPAGVSAAAEAHHQLAGGGGIERGDALGAGDLEDHVPVGLHLLDHRAEADLAALTQGVVGGDHQLAVDLPVLPLLIVLQRAEAEGLARQRGGAAQIVAEGGVDVVFLVTEHGVGHGGVEGADARASGKGVHARPLGEGHSRALGKGGNPALGPRQTAAAAGAEVRGILHLIAALRAKHDRFLSFVGVSARRAAPVCHFSVQYSTSNAKHQALRGNEGAGKNRGSGRGDGENGGKPERAEPKNSFSYDLNGILKVSAVLLSTGMEKGIEIDMTKGGEKARDLSGWKEAEGAKTWRAVIRTAERLLSRPQALPEALRGSLREATDELKKALIHGNREDAEAEGDTLRELLRIAKGGGV